MSFCAACSFAGLTLGVVFCLQGGVRVVRRPAHAAPGRRQQPARLRGADDALPLHEETRVLEHAREWAVGVFGWVGGRAGWCDFRVRKSGGLTLGVRFSWA